MLLCIALSSSARSRYEALKRQTQAELRQTFNSVLKEGGGRAGQGGEEEPPLRTPRWLFDLDISAPQIRVPQSLTDPNTTLVVFDLGHLQLCNSKAGVVGGAAGPGPANQSADLIGEEEDGKAVWSSHPYEEVSHLVAGLRCHDEMSSDIYCV